MVADRVGALIGRGLFTRRQARVLDETFSRTDGGGGGGGGGGAFGVGCRRAQTTAWDQSVQGSYTRLRGTDFAFEGGYEFPGADNPSFVTKPGSPNFDLAASAPAGWYSWTCRFLLPFTAGTPTSVEAQASTWWGDSYIWTFPVCPADSSPASANKPYVQQTVTLQPFFRPAYDPLADGCYFGVEFHIPLSSGFTLGGNKSAWYDVQRLA
jgi:hypothetical protein